MVQHPLTISAGDRVTRTEFSVYLTEDGIRRILQRAGILSETSEETNMISLRTTGSTYRFRLTMAGQSEIVDMMTDTEAEEHRKGLDETL